MTTHPSYRLCVASAEAIKMLNAKTNRMVSQLNSYLSYINKELNLEALPMQTLNAYQPLENFFSILYQLDHRYSNKVSSL